MPSSASRCSADSTRPSRMRSPARSCATTSRIESHSGVAYSGWLPTSRYRRAPFSRNTFDDRPQLTTLRKRYLATSSGDRRRWPRRTQVTPYSFSIPKMRRCTPPSYRRRAKVPRIKDADSQMPWEPSAASGCDLFRCQPPERAAIGGPVQETRLPSSEIDRMVSGRFDRTAGCGESGVQGHICAMLRIHR